MARIWHRYCRRDIDGEQNSFREAERRPRRKIHGEAMGTHPGIAMPITTIYAGPKVISKTRYYFLVMPRYHEQQNIRGQPLCLRASRDGAG